MRKMFQSVQRRKTYKYCFQPAKATKKLNSKRDRYPQYLQDNHSQFEKPARSYVTKLPNETLYWFCKMKEVTNLPKYCSSVVSFDFIQAKSLRGRSRSIPKVIGTCTHANASISFRFLLLHPFIHS